MNRILNMARQSKKYCVLLVMAFAVVVPGVATVAVAGDEANQEIINQVIDALKSDDPEMQTGAITIVRVPGPGAKALVQELPAPRPPGPTAVGLADRGTPGPAGGTRRSSAENPFAWRPSRPSALGLPRASRCWPSGPAAKGLSAKAAREPHRLGASRGDPAGLRPWVKVELIDAIGSNIGDANKRCW
jgi:hypothetical protein